MTPAEQKRLADLEEYAKTKKTIEPTRKRFDYLPKYKPKNINAYWNLTNFKDFNFDLFEDLCKLHCTTQEIQSVFRIGKKMLERFVSKKYKLPITRVMEAFAAAGKASLRRNQFLLSKKNVQMAIWLGKQWLAQKDKQELEYITISKEDEIVQR